MPPELHRQPKIPVHRQIADHYAREINAGHIALGERLPSGEEIASYWDVAPATAQQAIRDLADDGLVETGRTGTFVRRLPQIRIRRRAVARYRRAVREEGGGRGAFDAEIRGLGMTPRSEVEVDRVVPPPRVADVLNVAEDQPSVIRRLRRMYANDVPVQLAPSYIPAEIAAGTVLEEADTGPGGMLSRLADLGFAAKHLTESVTIRRATVEERRFLELAGDAPVIEIWHVGWTADWRPVEVCVHALPTSTWTLDYEWEADD